MGLFKKEEKEKPNSNFELRLPEFSGPTTLPKPPSFEKPIPTPKEIESYTPKPFTRTPMPTTGEKSLFVKIARYERVISSINEIKRNLDQTRDILNAIKTIKDQEDAKLQEWHDSLEEIKEKILKVDQILAESLK